MKKIILTMFIAALLIFPGSLAFAYDMTEAKAEMGLIAEALSGIFGPNLGGMSFLGEPVGYSFIPHFEVGIAGGMVLVPVDDITADTKMALIFGGLPRCPIPAAGAHVKFAIKRLEFGVKVAGIPDLEFEEKGIEVSNIILGGKVRYNLGDFDVFALKGGVSVGGFYEYMKGSLLLTDSKSVSIYVDEDDNPDGTLTNDAGFDTTWNANTFGGEAQANLQVLMLNFFAGTRVSKSIGKAKTVVSGSSELINLTGSVTGSTEPVKISGEAKPAKIDVFIFGGAEVKIAILTATVKAGYNVNNKYWAGDLGLRLQF
ncbi:hypothetical protein ES703_18903 [subsurface metagenome]